MTATRSDNMSRPHDCSYYFPEKAHYKVDHLEGDRILIRPYYHSIVDLVDKLITGMHCQKLCFSEELLKENFNTVNADHPINF